VPPKVVVPSELSRFLPFADLARAAGHSEFAPESQGGGGGGGGAGPQEGRQVLDLDWAAEKAEELAPVPASRAFSPGLGSQDYSLRVPFRTVLENLWKKPPLPLLRAKIRKQGQSKQTNLTNDQFDDSVGREDFLTSR
jgi:hypothetical protein